MAPLMAPSDPSWCSFLKFNASERDALLWYNRVQREVFSAVTNWQIGQAVQDLFWVWVMVTKPGSWKNRRPHIILENSAVCMKLEIPAPWDFLDLGFIVWPSKKKTWLILRWSNLACSSCDLKWPWKIYDKLKTFQVKRCHLVANRCNSLHSKVCTLEGCFHIDLLKEERFSAVILKYDNGPFSKKHVPCIQPVYDLTWTHNFGITDFN